LFPKLSGFTGVVNVVKCAPFVKFTLQRLDRLRHADAAHLLGFEVGVVVIAAPAWIIGVCCTSIAVWVYCAIVSVLASWFFFFEAFAVRAGILANVAHFANPFWVGHFYLCTILRVRECLAVARVDFEARVTELAEQVAACGFMGASRSTVRDRDDTVASCCGFLACRTGVGQTLVVVFIQRITWVALQTRFASLVGTEVDRCRCRA